MEAAFPLHTTTHPRPKAAPSPRRPPAPVPSISCTVSDTGRPPPFIEKDRESLPYHCRSDTERHTVL